MRAMANRSRTQPNRRPPAFEPDDVDEPRSGRGRLGIVLAGFAVLLAGAALAVAILRPAGGGLDCQPRAWDSVPDEDELPQGWSVSTSSFFVGSLTVTIDGPAASEESGAGSVFATVTCYGDDAGQALARSRAGEANSGGTVADLPDVGDDGYSVGDEATGLNSLHFRRGDLVAYLTASGEVDELDLIAVAEGFDAAMEAADGRSIAAGSTPSRLPAGSAPPTEPALEPSDELPVESAAPTEAPAAPELEAMLPREVDGIPLTVFSATGSDLPGGDAATRSLAASIRSLGATMDDLQIAEVYDETETLDLVLLAFRVPDANGARLRDIILESWLSANADGVQQEELRFGDKRVTAVDYGDEQVDTYVYTVEDTVIVITTLDREVAELTVSALP